MEGYRDATIYFYTGTGNSRRVATWVAETMAEAGSTVTLSPIGSARPAGEVGSGEGALLGLVMPTHAFTAPWVVLHFALRLPRRRKTHATIIAARGGLRIGRLYVPGFEGSATLLVALILAAKGYAIRGTAGIDMPANWTALHPGLPPQAVDEIIERARAKTHRFSDKVLSGQQVSSWLTWLIGLILLPISLGYLLIGRFFLAKLFFASHRCTECGLCAASCPNQAIEMRGEGSMIRPYWTSRCESCMRCMAYCPVEAVEASQGLAIGVYLLTRVVPTTAALGWLAARMPLIAFLRRVPPGIVLWATALATLALLYPPLHCLLRFKPFNWLFTHATLTHLYRRYHEPATPVEDLDRREAWTLKD